LEVGADEVAAAPAPSEEVKPAAPVPSEEVKPAVIEPTKVEEKPVAAQDENKTAVPKNKGKAGRKNDLQAGNAVDKEQQTAKPKKTLADHVKKTGKAMKAKKAGDTKRNKTAKAAAPKKVATHNQSSIIKKGAGSNKAAKRQNAIKKQKKEQTAKPTTKPEEPTTV